LWPDRAIWRRVILNSVFDGERKLGCNKFPFPTSDKNLGGAIR
jgi:hypothetical protein